MLIEVAETIDSSTEELGELSLESSNQSELVGNEAYEVNQNIQDIFLNQS